MAVWLPAGHPGDAVAADGLRPRAARVRHQLPCLEEHRMLIRKKLLRFFSQSLSTQLIIVLFCTNQMFIVVIFFKINHLEVKLLV